MGSTLYKLLELMLKNSFRQVLQPYNYLGIFPPLQTRMRLQSLKLKKNLTFNLNKNMQKGFDFSQLKQKISQSNLLLVDINECERFPCGNGANCINTMGSYYCQCPRGFTGADCRTGRQRVYDVR